MDNGVRKAVACSNLAESPRRHSATPAAALAAARGRHGTAVAAVPVGCGHRPGDGHPPADRLAPHELGQQALAYYHQALSIAREVSDRVGEAVTRYHIAMIHRADGNLDEAIRELEQVVDLDRQVEHPDLASDTAMLEQVRRERAQGHDSQLRISCRPVGDGQLRDQRYRWVR